MVDICLIYNYPVGALMLGQLGQSWDSESHAPQGLSRLVPLSRVLLTYKGTFTSHARSFCARIKTHALINARVNIRARSLVLIIFFSRNVSNK